MKKTLLIAILAIVTVSIYSCKKDVSQPEPNKIEIVPVKLK